MSKRNLLITSLILIVVVCGAVITTTRELEPSQPPRAEPVLQANAAPPSIDARLEECFDEIAKTLGAAAAQGIDLRAPLRTSARLQEVHALVRSKVAFYDHDRYFAPDITAIQALIEAGSLHRFVPGLLPSL